MVVLGLILILVAVVAGVVLVYENSGTDSIITITAFGGEWRTDAFWLAVIGAAILVVAVLGLTMIRAGSRRGLRRRQERKQLERENAALASQVRHPEPARDDVADGRDRYARSPYEKSEPAAPSYDPTPPTR